MEGCVYPVPVITMFTLKVVMPVILDDTLNVSVAAVDCPAFSVVFSLFQVKVIGPLALDGFQFVFVILSVIGTVPVFLT